jgi:hypothetical protein
MQWLIRFLGGYTSLEEAVKANRHEALTKCVADEFNSVTSEVILRQRADGTWDFEDRNLTFEEVKALRGEAQAILKTRMWKVLEKDLQYLANKAMYFNSKTEADLIAGKLILQIVREMRERLMKTSYEG